jgi:hypothetical protein
MAGWFGRVHCGCTGARCSSGMWWRAGEVSGAAQWAGMPWGRRFGGPVRAPPPRWSGTQRDRGAGEHYGHPGSMQERSPNRTQDVPHDLPIRESSPGGSYGTVPLRRMSELRRFRCGFPQWDAQLTRVGRLRRDAITVVIWRARAPIAIYGSIARMERSEPLAGASRRPSTVPDIDPRAGVVGYVPRPPTGGIAMFLQETPEGVDGLPLSLAALLF